MKLGDGQVIAVGEGGLANTTPIGAAPWGDPTRDEPKVITAAGDQDWSGRFQSDNPEWTVENSGTGASQVVQIAVASTFTISGQVIDNHADGIDGVTVALKKGAEVLKTTTTAFDSEANRNGWYEFTGVGAGSYNVVAAGTVNGIEQTVTELVEVTDRDVHEELTLSDGKASSVLELKSDSGVTTPAVVAGGLREEADHWRNENQGTQGFQSVTVTMTVEAQAADAAANAGEIQTLAGDDVTLEYLDVAVKKTLTTNNGTAATTETPVTETRKPLTLVIPFDPTGKYEVTAYRYHGDPASDGTAEVIPQAPSANADGESMTLGEDAVTLHVKKFSTYAIGYKDAPTEPPASSVAYYTVTASAGEGGKVLDPQGKVTRAEAATMIQRFFTIHKSK